MNKIRFSANMDTNYIFHMLSVSKCGYDNEYGKQYRHLYSESDLSVFQENESLLTVRGGEHRGDLYNLLVCEPARALIPAKEYYSRIIAKSRSGRIPQDLHPYIDILCRISEVMVKYYDIYADSIWEKEHRKILAYIPCVRPLFERIDFTERAEELVGCGLNADCFTAMLVTSVENGAEGIDISDSQDVFGIERDPMDSLFFIGHEYIIYLLFHALKNEDAFKSFDTWKITEGLAEYYLKQILGETRFFDSQKNIVDFFDEYCHPKKMTAVELYRKALNVFR